LPAAGPRSQRHQRRGGEIQGRRSIPQQRHRCQRAANGAAAKRTACAQRPAPVAHGGRAAGLPRSSPSRGRAPRRRWRWRQRAAEGERQDQVRRAGAERLDRSTRTGSFSASRAEILLSIAQQRQASAIEAAPAADSGPSAAGAEQAPPRTTIAAAAASRRLRCSPKTRTASAMVKGASRFRRSDRPARSGEPIQTA